MATQQRWDPQLVERCVDALFTAGPEVEFPAPPIYDDFAELPNPFAVLERFAESAFANVQTKMSSQAMPSSQPVTPKKGLGNASVNSLKTPTSKTGSPVPSGLPVPRTPKEKEKALVRPGTPPPPSSSSQAKAMAQPNAIPPVPVQMNSSGVLLGSNTNGQAPRFKDPMAPPAPATPPAEVKRAAPARQYPWPGHVPTDVELKGDSRSKLQPTTQRRVAAQEGFDPDFIFQQPPGELPMSVIFAKHPAVVAKFRQPRGLTGDWANDTFTVQEEEQYKKELRFQRWGPSQARRGFTY
jgi:hypothetical protein